MKIIDQSCEFIRKPNKKDLRIIERAARTCYQSEPGGDPKSFLKRLLASGHHSVFEHAAATVRIVCDRGITHELVRHRLCSFSQESTRYCNYSKDKFDGELTFIRPVYWPRENYLMYQWLEAVEEAERYYLELLDNGATAEEARAVLPNSLKAEIIITANLREWRHIFMLRCAKEAHPQIRALMIDALGMFKTAIPVIFDDLYPGEK